MVDHACYPITVHRAKKEPPPGVLPHRWAGSLWRIFLIIHWGRIGSQGDFKRYWHATEEEAYEQAARIVKKRIKRGYAFTSDSLRI